MHANRLAYVRVVSLPPWQSEASVCKHVAKWQADLVAPCMPLPWNAWKVGFPVGIRNGLARLPPARLSRTREMSSSRAP